jgi:hypothetical protein
LPRQQGIIRVFLIPINTRKILMKYMQHSSAIFLPATRYKYIPVGSLPPSMAAEVAFKKSPRNAATSLANILPFE